MKHEPFVVERIFAAPIDKVWAAITDKDQMKEWYFELSEFKSEVGFEFIFDATDCDITYRHICQVMEVIPGRKLKHSWRYDGCEGNSFVTWELFAEGDTTRLKLTHEGLDTFPTNNPAFAKESFAQGWTDIVGRSLKAFVEKAVKTELA